MYCIGCGVENIEGSAHCIRCGNSLVTLRTDRPAKPSVRASSAKLWNPDVAALLSIPFSAVFGAIIHALNWRRLGLRHRAVAAGIWALSILLALLGVAVYGFAAQLDEKSIEGYFGLTQIVTLVLWYFAAARRQGKYITHQLRNEYLRESWFVPVAMVVGLTGYLHLLDRML